jgi:AcrR family transcriptional regulator
VPSAARTSSRLPRGRHRLSREEVAATQRERLLRAMADVMAVKGYARTSVSDVLRAAHISRETFYEQFASKEDCFMSAFETANERLVAATAEAGPAAGADARRRLDRALRAYLDEIAADPAYARVFLIEVHAAGPAALQRRVELQQRFARALAAALGTRSRDDLFAIEALVAAIGAMVTARLAADDVDGLRALHRPLMRLVDRLSLIDTTAGG